MTSQSSAGQSERGEVRNSCLISTHCDAQERERENDGGLGYGMCVSLLCARCKGGFWVYTLLPLMSRFFLHVVVALASPAKHTPSYPKSPKKNIARVRRVCGLPSVPLSARRVCLQKIFLYIHGASNSKKRVSVYEAARSGTSISASPVVNGAAECVLLLFAPSCQLQNNGPVCNFV